MNPLRWLYNLILGPVDEREEHGPDDSVVAGYAESEIEADMWRTILARNDIPSAVIGPGRVPMYGVFDSTIRLEVLYRDQAAARELLALNEEGRPVTPITPIEEIAGSDEEAAAP